MLSQLNAWFACVSVIPIKYLIRACGVLLGSQLASVALEIGLSCFFLLSPHPFCRWEMGSLKELRLTAGHTNSANQGFLVKPVAFSLFRERNPKFKGGVMCYSFCNSITC